MIKKNELKKIELGENQIQYRLVRSGTARKFRVRVGIDGIEVVQPAGRNDEEVETFLRKNHNWILNQTGRMEYIRSMRNSRALNNHEILFHGDPIPISVKNGYRGNGQNKVVLEDGGLTINYNLKSLTSPVRSLEYWLRKQAKLEIIELLQEISEKLGTYPKKVYIRGQKTKWGNCSASMNLSFNWRLIMAPDFVKRYLVVHEMVHLKIMEHSNKFWLMVQGLCPEMEKAKQWLRKNGHKMMVDLRAIIKATEKLTFFEEKI